MSCDRTYEYDDVMNSMKGDVDSGDMKHEELQNLSAHILQILSKINNQFKKFNNQHKIAEEELRKSETSANNVNTERGVGVHEQMFAMMVALQTTHPTSRI